MEEMDGGKGWRKGMEEVDEEEEWMKERMD